MKKVLIAGDGWVVQLVLNTEGELFLEFQFKDGWIHTIMLDRRSNFFRDMWRMLGERNPDAIARSKDWEL